jgi:hypothetical protein
VISVLVELRYLGKSLWFGVIPALLWLGVLSLVAFSNHKRSHSILENQGDRSLENNTFASNQNMTVTRELMMELGLPMNSKATINLADFEHALERSAQAKMNEAQAYRVESIVLALKAETLDLDDAKALIQQTLGLLPPPEKFTQTDQTSQVISSRESIVDEWKGWKPWKK